MIVVKYREKIIANSLPTYVTLGTEMHDRIEEVILPRKIQGTTNPIFLTKRFSGHAEHRWEVVEDVEVVRDAATQTYIVTLARRAQVDKSCYLNNIVKTPGKSAARLLYRYAVVEVEYGHVQMIGKESGMLRTNKRYVDTLQSGSMPKRRLAIVNQVVARRNQTLIQVIPISSKEPSPGDKTAVEVTSCLTKLVNYNRRSWAVCGMIETVSANRVLAPMVRFSVARQARDTGFGQSISPPVRIQLRDALMHGVASGQRVNEALKLQTVELTLADLTTELNALRAKVANLEKDSIMYGNVAKLYADESGSTLEEVVKLANA